MNLRLAAILSVIGTTGGCAVTAESPAGVEPEYRYTGNAGFEAIRQSAEGRSQDRAAIRAMQGEYQVDFNFQETVALEAGYERRADKTTGGYELVLLIEDQPDKIVLQHLLVTPGGAVIKHWRQDWTFEARDRIEFIAEQTWQVRPLDEDQQNGTWTQCVFEVSDAPRYCGTGKWRHRYGVSTWTSDRSWRPLPRREYTKRNDYNALNVENRHTVTPNGWTHEQDNTKTIRDGSETVSTLVREFGFNNYRNIEGFDFEPARAYWDETGEYWAAVRSAWQRRLTPGSTVVLDTEVDGMPLIAGTLGQAANAAKTSAAEERDAIENLLSTYTRTGERLVSSND